MAKNSQSQRPDHELRQQIAHSRDRLSRDLDGLRYELDFPLKFRKSFQRKTVLWVGAAVVVGLILTIRPTRKKTVYVETDSKREHDPEKKLLGAGFMLAVLNVAAKLLRPMIISYATKKLGGLVDRKTVRRM